MLIPSIFAQEQDELLVMGGMPATGLVLPGAVARDTNGNFYIINEGTNEILSLTTKLDYRLRFGGYGNGEGSLKTPAHILINKGRVIISDVGCLMVFDQRGNFKEKITKIGENDIRRPMGLSVDSRNRIYIADPDLGKIIICEWDFKPYKVIDEFVEEPVHCFVTSTHRFVILDRATKKGLILSSYFERIKEFGEFENPVSITTDGVRRIFVLDNSTIHVFNIGGDSRFKWRLAPKMPGGFYPSMILADDNLLVASRDTNELLEVDGDDGRVKVILEHDNALLCLPEGHAVDENGRIYISDTQHDKIRVVNQQGFHLFEIPVLKPGRISVSQNLLAVTKHSENKISIFTREGGSLYDIEIPNPIDCDFTEDDKLLILTASGKVLKYSGSEYISSIVEETNPITKPVSIDYNRDYITISSEKSVTVMTRLGEISWNVSLDETPTDVMLLSPQRVIIATDDGISLIDQLGEKMSHFGSSGGIRSFGTKLDPKIEHQKNLEKFTNPVSLSRFGDWIYVLDKIAMRVSRFDKGVLLSPPEIKVSPKIINFGDIPANTKAEREIVIQNVGGETLEGSFSVIPKWLTLSSKMFKGDDVVVKVTAKTNHFIPNMEYRENIILDSNAGKIVIPCMLRVPDFLLNQIDITIQIGNSVATIGDEKVDLGISPFIMDGKTMVPLRFISEAFGGSVDFDEGYIDISFPKKDIWVSIQVGDESVILEVGDESRFLKINPAPLIKSGTTFVPLTFFTDILDCETYWDSKTKSIRLVYIQN